VGCSENGLFQHEGLMEDRSSGEGSLMHEKKAAAGSRLAMMI
jgi:hypothetical protein